LAYPKACVFLGSSVLPAPSATYSLRSWYNKWISYFIF